LESGGLPEGAEKKHCLWALALMRTYETKANLSTKVGAVDESTLRNGAWLVVDADSWLELDLILWENRLKDDQQGNDCLVSVDAFQVLKNGVQSKRRW
jgi:hypothetical protein